MVKRSLIAQRTKQVLTYIESTTGAIRHYGDTEMYSSLQAVKNRLFDLYREFIYKGKP